MLRYAYENDDNKKILRTKELKRMLMFGMKIYTFFKNDFFKINKSMWIDRMNVVTIK